MKNLVILEASQGQNRLLATQIATAAGELAMQCARWDLVALDLPLFSVAAEQKSMNSFKLNELAAQMRQGDGLVVVSPEYNGGLPPSLVNVIAWVSRLQLQGGWRACFEHKPTLIASASGGTGIRLLCSLRTQLSYLGAQVLAREISLTGADQLEQDIRAAMVEMDRLCQAPPPVRSRC